MFNKWNDCAYSYNELLCDRGGDDVIKTFKWERGTDTGSEYIGIWPGRQANVSVIYCRYVIPTSTMPILILNHPISFPWQEPPIIF